MSFVFVGALAILLLVVAPVAAHLLRVRRAEQRPFPPAKLVPASPPATRQRRTLQDRALFAIRALAVAALALLGATPLIQCSRLAIARSSGANVALVIVVDDSMSMRARDDGSVTRFETARKDALDLVAGAREGDSIALVLAGDPVRVALAPTTDLNAATSAIEALQPSDRATDLDGAVALSASLSANLPQSQKRIVMLTDRCDGQPDRKPIGEGASAPVWVPVRSQADDPQDCAVLHAERREGRIVARVACAGKKPAPQRKLVARSGDDVIGSIAFDDQFVMRDGVTEIEVPAGSRGHEVRNVALEGMQDLIAENDEAPVAHQAEALTVGVLSDRTLTKVETGGAPPVEQALSALQSGATIQPIPAVPDVAEDLTKFTALVLDDPAGFTPEARDAIRKWIDGGGIALIGLGPMAARAPLGATLDPFVPGVPRWIDNAPKGIRMEDAAALGPSGSSLADIAPQGRTQLEPDRLEHAQVLVRWADGAPLFIERRMGRGVAYLVGLPLNPASSDLPLRPAFLAMLSQVIESARARGGAKRIEVGRAWVFPREVEARTLDGPFPVEQHDGAFRVVPTKAGRYDVRIDGQVDTRFAVIAEREMDLRPRAVAESTQDTSLGSTKASVDVSQWIALALLGLLAAELALRLTAAEPATET